MKNASFKFKMTRESDPSRSLKVTKKASKMKCDFHYVQVDSVKLAASFKGLFVGINNKETI